MNQGVLLIILGVIQRSYAVIHQLSDEEYDQMPPTSSMEPVATCLRRPGGRYCTAYATYVTDDASPLLTLMQEYSDYTSSRFNHTRALFGVCLTHKCKDMGENTTLVPRILLEQCLNRSVWNEYKLKVKVEEEVLCLEHGEDKPEVGAVDIAVSVIILALVVCNTVGSLIDILFPKLDGLVCQFLQCFSITRNWKILTAPAGGSDPRLESLKGIYGIRAISMIGVIIAHGLMATNLVTENTKFIEDLYDAPATHVLLNGSIIMQTFVFLSAFFLIYSCQMYAETHQVTWRVLPMGVLRRWLRLTPPYALVLAFTATWLPRLNTVPIWNFLSGTVSESEACRRDWWQHLLYINNYCEARCMPQTWYLAADTQLYCLGLVIFVCCQTVRVRKVVLSVLFVLGLTVPALITYFQDLDGPLLASPTASAAWFWEDRTFNSVYTQAHTNLSPSVLGLAAGYLVFSLQKNHFDASKYKAWLPLYWLLFPLGLAVPISCKMFYAVPKVGILYRAAAAALYKPVFVLIVTIIVVGMIFKMEKLYRGILEWGGWVPLSRVSYSAYLVHVAFLHAARGAGDLPLHASHLRLIEMTLFTTVMVYIAAYLFWLTVEAPLTQVVKTCLQPRPAREKKQE